MPATIIDLSTTKLHLVLKSEGQSLTLAQFETGGQKWLHPAFPARLFTVVVNGQPYHAGNLRLQGVSETAPAAGVRQLTLSFAGPGFLVEQHLKVYDDTALIELWPVIRNQSAPVCRVERVDSVSLDLQAAGAELLYYTSNWGAEFELQQAKLAGEAILETRSGRSSKGQHPWFALRRADGPVFSGSVAWSGNWVFRFEPLVEDGWRVSGGLHDWSFAKELAPGDALEGPPVVLALGDSLNTVSQQYALVGRGHWYPRNALSARLPVEWNHWWSYEDVEINEEVFRLNVDRAAELGFEVCTLDAGWFGPSDPATHWYEYRGDWRLVNERRFPSGIRALSDYTHQHGMRFGLWCEIEGLGINAQLARDHPDFPATRAGERLGYVCFGNPDVQEWAYQTLSRLITEYDCDWIKLDFNLDPGAGCDRADHGHQAGDGLYEHYRGYYRTLERVRWAFPEVVLENCSSGGLRIDLGILRQTCMTYLSDPDWPVHDLQIFWGASTMLAPEVLLHWSFGEWRMEKPPAQQTFNPRNPRLTQKQLDYYTRISMLGWYGFSQKLPDLPGWVAARLETHTRLYKEQVRRFVRQGDLYRLTGQPRRSGAGERWSAFQYSLPGGVEHLLFVFRLPGATPERSIRLGNLQPERVYRIEGLEGEHSRQALGRDLMETGLSFNWLEEEESVLYKIS
jgi:alpha-galactosidase